MNNKNITLVTAYFELPHSKFNNNIYENWIKNFLLIKTPIVVYTNKPNFIKNHRDNYLPITVIECNIKDFLVYKYLDQWKEHLNIDHEKKIHNINLYMIWNEKSNFIKKTIDLNPYNTDYFYWTDIGAFRDTDITKKYYLNYPNKTTDKILLLQINQFTVNEINQIYNFNNNNNTNTKNIFQYQNRIGGGIFGGHKDNCLIWHKKYYDMLDTFFKNNQFAGKDQSIMATVAILNPELVIVVNHDKKLFDEWFYLQEYLTF